MKSLMMALLLISSVAMASPNGPEGPLQELPKTYFKVIGADGSVHTAMGALFRFNADPTKSAQIETAVALLTHAADPNNSLLPADWARAGYAETWVIGAGISNGAGETALTIGPSFNVMPWMKRPVYDLLSHTDQEKWFWRNLRRIFDPTPTGWGDVAAGPQFNVKIIENGAMLEPGKWQGGFRAWAGKSWVF